ncbi:uncharacterized protein LOC127839681 [Dreissena polymorpha]|uniref:uncharacterized protein LOC127839681 n=1 Tax=Dreissena polymorpha TaxID=45954 RepID=UPI00226546F5|nr:uncharacterized protein LOC127839681 [Dreissena polymorpha]
MFLADCGMLGTVRGASVSVTSTQLCGTATYTCDLGYGYTGGNLTRTCQSSAQWSGTKPVCVYRAIISRAILLVLCGELCTACGRRRSSQVLDKAPPSLSGCPGNLHYYTDPLKLYSTHVEWTEPTAWDNSDGSVGAQRIEGNGPGHVFYVGLHTIRYMTKDNTGNTATCGFTVTVEAKYCRPWATVRHGWVVCDPSVDMLVGTLCTFGCFPGYNLHGSNTTICEAQDRWSVTSLPTCVHVTPPMYAECPSLLVFYADKSHDFTTVNWQEPLHSDNAGLAGTVARQVRGPSPGTVVQVGEYTVVYQAWDSENNTSTCEIQLAVKQITCHSLYPRPYTKVECTDGRRFGSQCGFTCQEGASLKGDNIVYCDAWNSSDILYGMWTFGSSQPFCELEGKCLRPSAPEHGALSCDTWAGGAYCVLQCEKGYVVQDSEFDPLLTCSDISGVFSNVKDDGKLPPCTAWEPDPFFNYQLDEYYYFDGDCWAAKEQIKQNFIAALLSSLGNVCTATNCNASYVEVYCFNETRQARERRSVPKTLTVSVILTVSGEGQNKLSPTDAIMMQEQIYRARTESNASLEIGHGQYMQLTSLHVSNPEVTCSLGSIADSVMLACGKENFSSST